MIRCLLSFIGGILFTIFFPLAVAAIRGWRRP